MTQPTVFDVIATALALISLIVAIYLAHNARAARRAAQRSARAAESTAASAARQLQLKERELSRTPWVILTLEGGQCGFINDSPAPMYAVSVVGPAVQFAGTVAVLEAGSQVRFWDVRDLDTTSEEVRVTWSSSPGAAMQVWTGRLP